MSDRKVAIAKRVRAERQASAAHAAVDAAALGGPAGVGRVPSRARRARVPRVSLVLLGRIAATLRARPAQLLERMLSTNASRRPR
jgi:hypothetical protein